MSEVELPKSVRILRRVVIIMGYMLVCGFFGVIFTAYYKFSNRPAKPEIANQEKTEAKPEIIATKATQPQIPASAEKPATKCAFKQKADLAIYGDITNYSLSDNILTVITAAKHAPTLIKQQEGNSLTLTSQKPSPTPHEIVIFDLCKGEVLSRISLTGDK